MKEKLKNVSKATWIKVSIITAAVIVVASVTTVLVVQHRKKLAQPKVKKVVASTQKKTTTEPTTEPKEIIKAKLQCFSVQNDLKIKFVREDNNEYIKDVPFEVVVTDKKGKEKIYQDKKGTGKIYVEKVKAGDYSVKLKPVEGFELATEDVKVTVKDKVEYKPIADIKEKVVKDVGGKEDTKPKPQPQQTIIKDTVKYVNSSEEVVTPTVTKYIVVDFETVINPKVGDETPTPKTLSVVTENEEENTDNSSTVTETQAPQPLKDLNGRLLYIKNAEQYVQAYTNDYSSENQFYIKEVTPEVVIYKGWQIFNKDRYYYDENGKKVTGEQIILGAKYVFGDDGKLYSKTGIDVSKWQGDIDWKMVKESGVEFAIIRLGYRGWGTGKLVEDVNFRKNINGARKNGIDVGVYFFTQAINEVEAVEEASMCVEIAKNYKLKYPIFIDSETSGGKGSGRADNLSRETRTAVCKAFCETVRSKGYKVGVYASKYWFRDRLDEPQLNKYCIWLAHYTQKTNYTNKYDIWQYSSKGNIKGINGNVDVNISYKKYW